ncbi:MAG: hypothetical protein CME18_05805 [Gemmatimonadetes bacterium]|nr:hypothetical protein [Gemmatimonadota bacterium]
MDDWAGFTEAARRPEPVVFRVCAGRVTEHALIERLRAHGFEMEPVNGVPGFHRVKEGPGPLSATREHWLGLLYVQQASTGVAAPAIAPEPGEHVLDLCSAPGGKTLHMAELMEDSGCLVASEVSEPRIRGLLGNVYRLGNSNIMVTAGDGRDFPVGATFDRVLVDAPCSGEGTLRRGGGRAPNQSMSFLSYVTKAQRALLERAVKVTRPGGVILYVTCTFAPEENEAVVTEALRRLPVELEPLALPIDHAPGLTHFEGVRFDPRLEGAARIYPHHLDSGGLFMARFRKLDDGEDRSFEDSVPAVFPGDDLSVDEAKERLGHALDELRGRYGLGHGLDRLRWILRGGRAWFHTLDAWPFPVWENGSWRAVSVGVRGIDFDSRGRPRPSNDLLRLLGDGMTGRTVDVNDDEMRTLIAREPVAVAEEERGPIGIRHHGDLIGRGALTVDGLKSEIPKARAADYLRSLS